MHPEDDRIALLQGIASALLAEGLVFAILIGLAAAVLK